MTTEAGSSSLNMSAGHSLHVEVGGGWEANAEEQQLVDEILREGESLLDMLPEDEAEVLVV
jgi:hypothetical protein